MADSQLDIGSFSGNNELEGPRVFFTHGEKITVTKVLSTWVEEEGPRGMHRRFYKVEGTDGFAHTLYYDRGTGAWFYRGFEKKTKS